LTDARSDPSIVWWLYVLLCEGEYLYVGISPDPLRRFRDHVAGKSRATKMRRPLEMLACIPIGSYREASREESTLKRKERAKKIEWVSIAQRSEAWQVIIETRRAQLPIGTPGNDHPEPACRGGPCRRS
jgi:putative endonuclease